MYLNVFKWKSLMIMGQIATRVARWFVFKPKIPIGIKLWLVLQ
jgi:hypothetical protein